MVWKLIKPSGEMSIWEPPFPNCHCPKMLCLLTAKKALVKGRRGQSLTWRANHSGTRTWRGLANLKYNHEIKRQLRASFMGSRILKLKKSSEDQSPWLTIYWNDLVGIWKHSTRILIDSIQNRVCACTCAHARAFSSIWAFMLDVQGEWTGMWEPWRETLNMTVTAC